MGRTVDLARQEQFRDKILGVASMMFKQMGYERTSMRALAGRLGVTAPCIYYYFRCKQDLLYACLQNGLVDLDAANQAAMASAEGTATERLMALIRAMGNWQLKPARDPAPHGLSVLGPGDPIGTYMTPQQRRKLRAIQQQYFRKLKEVLELGARSKEFKVIDATVTAFAMIALGEHACRWIRPGGRLGCDEIVELHTRIALRMVGADSESTGIEEHAVVALT